MPNIKSSIRSVKTDAERRAKNAAVKSQIRTASRKTVEAVQAGAVEEAKQALVHATSVIDKAASKGCFFMPFFIFYIMIVSFFIQLYFITPYGQIRGLLL